MEKFLKEKKIAIGQEIKFESLTGLRVDVLTTQVKEDKPLLYTYTYSIDNLKFQEWLKSQAYLCEGPFAFTIKGVQFMIMGGPEKWDKSAFSIDDDSGDKVFLELFKEDTVFHVHRDLFKGMEWEVLIATPEERAIF